MDGFSIFYSPRGEMVLDQMTSVTGKFQKNFKKFQKYLKIFIKIIF